MQVIENEKAFPGAACVVALGTFDGVHAGHVRLIREAQRIAAEKALPTLVATFDRSPLEVLCPERAPKMLMTTRQKLDKLAELGVDYALVRRFTPALAGEDADIYLRRLCAALHPAAIVVGFNYTFGHGGRGNAALIRERSEKYGYQAVVVQPVMVDGEVVSSTRIRALLQAGDAAAAARLMAADDTQD